MKSYLTYIHRDNFFRICFIILLFSTLSIYYIRLQKNELINVNRGETTDINIIPQDKIDQITYLSIKNRLGEIELIKESPSPFPWLIANHGNILADTNKVQSLVELLKFIKIKRQIKVDDISLKNYSMDNPFFTFDYLIPGHQIIRLKVGLINDLRNIAYIQHEQSQTIFEASYRSLSIFDNNFSYFANNGPFSFISEKAKRITLSRGNKPALEIERENENWILPKTNFNKQKLELWLKSLNEIKTTIILDKVDEKINQRLNDSQKDWNKTTLTIETIDNNIYEYNLYLVKGISDDSKKNETDYVLYDKHRPFPVVLNQDAKKLLTVTMRSFK